MDRRSAVRWRAVRPRKRRLLLLAALAAALGLAWWTPATGRAAGPVTTSMWLPFPSSTVIGGKEVTFTGAIHMVVQAYPTDPTVPPNPIRIYTDLVNVAGEDKEGGTYRCTGGTQFTSEQAPPGDYEFTGAYRLQPTDPCRLRFVVSVSADGTVAAASAQFDVGGDVDVDSP